jgi:hypothetical protein
LEWIPWPEEWQQGADEVEVDSSTAVDAEARPTGFVADFRVAEADTPLDGIATVQAVPDATAEACCLETGEAVLLEPLNALPLTDFDATLDVFLELDTQVSCDASEHEAWKLTHGSGL